MTSTEQLHQDFIREFTELLQRYNAEFDRGSGHYGGGPEIWFNGIYRGDEVIRQVSYISLPSIYPSQP